MVYELFIVLTRRAVKSKAFNHGEPFKRVTSDKANRDSYYVNLRFLNSIIYNLMWFCWIINTVSYRDTMCLLLTAFKFLNEASFFTLHET